MQVQPKSPGPKEFFRAATDSLLDAKILFSASRAVGAVYLGGYCVECSLKALILFRTTNSKWHIHVESFQGRKGHDLERLRRVYLKTGGSIPQNISSAFRRVNSWSTDLRYRTIRVKMDDANEFLKSVQLIFTWMERQF